MKGVFGGAGGAEALSRDRAAAVLQAHWRGRQARRMLPVHRARAALRRAVQRLSRTEGRDALPTADIVKRTHDLARAYDAAGKPALAEKCYVQANDMAQSGGCTASEAAFHVHALVAFLKRQNRSAEAKAVLQAVAPPPRVDVQRGQQAAGRGAQQPQQQQPAAAAGAGGQQMALEGREPPLVRGLSPARRALIQPPSPAHF